MTNLLESSRIHKLNNSLTKYNVVSFSGGKDSTAMLLHMLELDMPIDEIILCDTTVEFPQMYDHINKVEKFIRRPITRLAQKNNFEYYLLKKKVHHTRGRFKGMTTCGYGFPFIKSRWCTRIFKTQAVEKHLREIAAGKEINEYVGIAADETKRVKDKLYPLVEWGWTEKDCLQYCYSKGFDWSGLYEHFDRLSCWCCPMQRIGAWRNLRQFFPNLWSKLLEWEERKIEMDGSICGLTSRYSAHDLDVRFALEEKHTSLGLPIKNREFYELLKAKKREMTV